jgi:hypothetical protein
MAFGTPISLAFIQTVNYHLRYSIQSLFLPIIEKCFISFSILRPLTFVLVLMLILSFLSRILLLTNKTIQCY